MHNNKSPIVRRVICTIHGTNLRDQIVQYYSMGFFAAAKLLVITAEQIGKIFLFSILIMVFPCGGL